MDIPTPTGWRSEKERLVKEFHFTNFVHAMKFMQQVSVVCEELNHHPEWKNIYNKIWIELTTHDTGNITEKDFQLAKEMNRIFKEYE